MKYAVIVDNGGGPNLIYHDVEGEVYTFPANYRQLLLTGTKVVYQRSEKTEDQPKGLTRLMNEAHYFATAVIEEVLETDNGNYRAIIKDFVRFKYGVPFRKSDGEHWETASGQFWRNGVRATNQEVYDAIVTASNTPPIPAAVYRRGVGVRSTKILSTGIESKAFANDKLKIVTAKDGYYLKSLSDGIFYQLVRKTLSEYDNGSLKVLRSIDGNTFIIHHVLFSSQKIGSIEIVDHGVIFRSDIDRQEISLKVML